MSADQDGGKYR